MTKESGATRDPAEPVPPGLVGRWIHAYEEDGPHGEVYRRDGAELPLSRRPRERLEFRADGTATVSTAGPDDRARDQAARWSAEAGEVIMKLRSGQEGARELRVLQKDHERIVIRRGGT